jgi:hypothetical protein
MARGSRESVSYTGDVCFRDQTILKAAYFEDVKTRFIASEIPPNRLDKNCPFHQLDRAGDDRMESTACVFHGSSRA